jgi:uncharacterized delta-60 repeat protein
VVAVAAARYHAMAVEVDGTVHAWGGEGSDSQGVSAIPAGLNNVKDVAAGETISIVLRHTGEVVSWGPEYTTHADTPASLAGVTVEAISAGNHHGLALTDGGEVVAWGQNYSGQSTVPGGLADIVAVAGGGWHSMALRDDGTVAAWGYNGYGQTDVPAGLDDVIAIAAGDYHCLALRENGTIVAWGWNLNGQTDIPAGLDEVLAVEAADQRSLALRQDGSVVAWGINNHWGQGDVPVDLGPALAITAGGYHNLAIVSPAVPPPGTPLGYIPKGDQWRFWDRGSEPVGSWTIEHYGDSTWGSGPAELGYGDGDEATEVSFGPDPSDKYITTYFRRSFPAASPRIVAELDAWLLYDDGAVVYLNGTEVARINMPADPVGNDTEASSAVPNNAIAAFSIDPGLLIEGKNLVAVEVHQVSRTSSDLSFDFELIGTAGAPPPTPPAGSLDESFVGTLEGAGTVLALARQPADDKILVGGYFTGISGGSRAHLARLEPDGALDATFVPAEPDALVREVQSLSTGDVLIGGNFLRIGGSIRPGVAKLDADGNHIGSFFPEIGEPAYMDALLEQADGQLLLTGWFSGYGTPSGHRLGRFDPTIGSFDLSFDSPAANNSIFCLALQPDEMILAGGGFTTIHGVARSGVARLHPDGNLDETFNQGSGVIAHVRAMALQSDGKIVIGGDVYNVHGVQTHNIARLNADGSLDAGFHLPLLDLGRVNAVAVQPDGRILVAGDFRTVDGLDYVGIVRLHPDGTVDPSFDPGGGIEGVDAEIHAMLLLPDGDILIGGEFSSYDGVPVNGLARINGGTGSAATPFVVRGIEERTVELVVTPPGGTSVHAVEDQLPETWSAVAITHGGVFDALTGKVKFGPFHDDTPRTLRYRLVPGPRADGVFLLSGEGSADGVNSAVAGESEVVVSGRHPADLYPADWMMEQHEVTAYATAWRAGAAWPEDPNPIPMNYVTRAAVLWRKGECYEIDGQRPGPPNWWVPCGPPAANNPSSEDKDDAEATVDRRVSGSFVPGETVVVTIHVVPPADMSAWALEDVVPEGWSAANVSHQGEVDAVHGMLKWGPFTDDQARELSYELISPAGADSEVTFAGSVSFDGLSAVVNGVQETSPTCRIVSFETMPDGRLSFDIRGLESSSFGIESSVDLLNWSPLETVTSIDGRIEFSDPESAAGKRFYRLRLVTE